MANEAKTKIDLPKAVTPKVGIPQKQNIPKIGLPDWEVKQRTFVLLKGKNLESKWIQTKSTAKKPLHYWDGFKNRVLRYAANFDTPFMDEQDGTATLLNIRIKNGSIVIPDNEIGKQQFMMVHPDYDVKWTILDKEQEAVDEMALLDMEFEAMKIARESDPAVLESILRAHIGSRVDSLTSAEVKKDALLLSKQNPFKFLELANDDDLQLRNLAIKAFEFGFLSLSPDNSYVIRTDTKSKVLDIGFDENHFTKLTQYFKNDEGLTLFKSLKKAVQ